jgi:TPP-dependent pyruvate/acetoin dehydrogenase alpha subunit
LKSSFNGTGIMGKRKESNLNKKQVHTADITNPTNIAPNIQRSMYVTMVRLRKFEERVAQLLMPPKEIITPCHLYIGQEAVATGVCANLRNDDYVFSTHRSHGHYLAKGGDMKALMAELYCKKTGCSKGKGGSMHIASPNVGLPGSSAIVGGTIPIAVGTALAFSMQKKNGVSVAFFGDGAVQEGVFYESLNFASLKKLPVIFVCENNLYCTHLPIAACLADTEIYKKASVFAMSGIRVDGNNVIEVFSTAKKAIEDARSGKGPTLIECMTYRWRGHVGPYDDLDQGLRSKEELDCWTKKCPIRRFERLLLEQGIILDTEKDQIHKDISEEVEESVIFARESPYPDKAELTRNVFKQK